MNLFLAKSIIPTIAFAGLASVMLNEPAAARKLNSCQVKHSYCSERCIMNYDGGAINSCIQRTCNRQHPGCGPESLGSSGGRRGFTTNLPQTEPVAARPQSPSRPGNSGPFVPSGRNPTGGIVPEGRNPTGGIVPPGHTGADTPKTGTHHPEPGPVVATRDHRKRVVRDHRSPEPSPVVERRDHRARVVRDHRGVLR
jgi:hypothetical protein